MAWSKVWTTSYWALGPYTSEAVKGNAQEVYTQLKGAGWTDNAAFAVIGNLCHESCGINPAQWEGGRGYSWDFGFGVAQWTPATKVSNYIGSQAQGVVDDGTAQINLLLSDAGQYTTAFLNPDGTSNYYNLSGLPYLTTLAAFSQSTAPVDDLTKVWAVCWERPNNQYAAFDTRIMYARYFAQLLDPAPPPTGQHSIYVGSSGNGAAYADRQYAGYGDTVNLTAVAGAGASFVSWITSGLGPDVFTGTWEKATYNNSGYVRTPNNNTYAAVPPNIPARGGTYLEVLWTPNQYAGSYVYLHQFNAQGTRIQYNSANISAGKIKRLLQENTTHVGIHVYGSGCTNWQLLIPASISVHHAWPDINGNSFIMPAENVTITGVFTGDAPSPSEVDYYSIWLYYQWAKERRTRGL